MATTTFAPVAAQPVDWGTPYSVSGTRPSGLGGIFGSVHGKRPGTVGNPDPYANLANIFPALPDINAQIANNLYGRLSGTGDMDYLRNLAANLGVTSGVGAGGPVKSGFIDNSMLIGGMLDRNAAMQDYNALMGTISGTQVLSPALMLENAWWNATNRASPNPGMAGIHSGIMGIGGGAMGALI